MMDYPDDADRPLVTFEDVVNWLRNILAMIGLMATCVGIGLHHAGFFSWLLSLK